MMRLRSADFNAGYLTPWVVRMLRSRGCVTMAAPCRHFSLYCVPRFTTMTPGQFAEFVAAETAKWEKLIREVGIRAD